MRRFILTYLGSRHHEPICEETVREFVLSRLGTRSKFHDKVITIEDFKVEELIPVKLSMKLEIV